MKSYPDTYWLHKRNLQLELENEELRKLAGDRAALVAELATTHDRMTLDLILCGALSSPKKDTTMQQSEVQVTSTTDPAVEEQLALSELVASFRQIADYIEQEKASLDDRRLQNALEQIILGLRQTLDAGRMRRFAGGKVSSELDEVQALLTRAVADGKFLTLTPHNYDLESEAMRLLQERGSEQTAGIVASTKVEQTWRVAAGARDGSLLVSFNVKVTLSRIER